MGIIFKILGQGYAYMALLWFVSYHSSFKKKEWISYYDEEDLKLVPDCANRGYYKEYYTKTGAVIKSLGFGGFIAIIMILTDGFFLVGGISWGMLGLMDLDIGWLLVIGCSAVASRIYYGKIGDKIIR